MTDLAAYLDTLNGGDNTALLEVRTFKTDGAPSGRLWSTTAAYDGRELPDYIRERGQHETVYIGAAPRTHRAGGRAAVKVAHVLWTDCDTPESVERLHAFSHAPTMTVSSGTATNLHAYWRMSKPLAARYVVAANRRLAHHFGADMKCAEAARVLRPPGTLNWKTDPPNPVAVASYTGQRFTVAKVVADLPDPTRAPDPNRGGPRVAPLPDELGHISPLDYFPRLTGREVGHNGKAQCPFHGGGKERTPSLHVYADPAKGWTCFGCGAGGTVFDLGAALWDLPTRGEGFKELRERLAREMGVA